MSDLYQIGGLTFDPSNPYGYNYLYINKPATNLAPVMMFNGGSYYYGRIEFLDSNGDTKAVIKSDGTFAMYFDCRSSTTGFLFTTNGGVPLLWIKPNGDIYGQNQTLMINSTSLGSAITTSSLTSLGTLSSLTVSGDVTIDSSTLKVDSTNNRVGVNNATPAYNLDVVGNVNVTGNYLVNGNAIGSTLPMTLDTGNNRVGINNVTPSHTLDVTGNVNTTGTYKINGTDILTSTTLGSGITSSSLTSLGTLSSLSVTGDVTIDSSTLKVDSTNNRVGIVNTTPSHPLDVTGNVNTTGTYKVSGTDVLSYSSGNVTLGGTNIYFPEKTNNITCDLKVPAFSAASLGVIGSLINGYQFSGTTTESVVVSAQLPYDWAEGTSITPQFHWINGSGTGNIVWELIYSIANIAEVYPASTTLTKTTGVTTTQTHNITDFGAISMTGKTTNCLFYGKLSRLGANAADTYNGTPMIISFNLQYTRNKWG